MHNQGAHGALGVGPQLGKVQNLTIPGSYPRRGVRSRGRWGVGERRRDSLPRELGARRDRELHASVARSPSRASRSSESRHAASSIEKERDDRVAKASLA
jgi:hypothetical protein